jgi:hypothetical protein
MKHLRRAGLSLLVVLALAGAGASAASAALPEFVPGAPAGLESTMKTIKLETIGKVRVTCKHGGDGGSMTGPKTVSVKLFLIECSIPGALCTSPGAAPGNIETATLTGTLGYIHKAMKVVGLDLTSPSAPFMVFNCGATPFVVEGSLIGHITPINKLLAPGEFFALKFAQKEGHQKPTNLEGEPLDVLMTSVGGKPFEPSGLAAVDDLFFTAPEEVHA